jgi:hypothetical protein
MNRGVVRRSWRAVGARVGLVLALVLPGCAAPRSAKPVELKHTLAGNPELPAVEIRNAISKDAWKTLGEREYLAYLLLDGSLDRQGRLINHHLLKSYPDDSWMRFVPEALEGVYLPAVTVGSHLNPRAMMHVVFYRSPEGPLALVYARPVETADPRTPGGSYVAFVSLALRPTEPGEGIR